MILCIKATNPEVFKHLFRNETGVRGNTTMAKPILIPAEKIELIVSPEPLAVIFFISLFSWLFYKFFLKSLSPERHENLKGQFSNLTLHLATLMILSAIYTVGSTLEFSGPMKVVVTYLGLLALFWAAVVFVKTARIIAFEYLFLGSMKVGVPLLLVNLFTLILSLVLFAWAATDIFGFQISSVIATSAIVSVVLGLALQETLGNLFAGVALQFDKPYEIGDWIEVLSSGQKMVGQVQEISWRATILIGFAEEVITIPNRSISMATINNFSSSEKPIIRSQFFRLSYDADIPRTKELLEKVALSNEFVLKSPKPICLLMNTAESWVEMKLIYFIQDYGLQYSIGDKILTQALKDLREQNIALATPRSVIEYKEQKIP